MIASRLDADIHANTCRLAFYGRLLSPADASSKDKLHAQLKIYKYKKRSGSVDRVDNDPYVVIGKDLFKKETNMNMFVGMKISYLEDGTGEAGVVESAFGLSGKFKVRFQNPQKKVPPGTPLFFFFKRYIFDSTKRMVQ
jgi:selenocysteine-specific elongation factor